MTSYKITIHEHVIYDCFVDAESKMEAEEIVESSIIAYDKSMWSIDEMAGWIDIGDIERTDVDA